MRLFFKHFEPLAGMKYASSAIVFIVLISVDRPTHAHTRH